MKFPPDDMQIFRGDRQFAGGYASGLIYFYRMWTNRKDDDEVPVICNPKTGRYETLPYIRRYRKSYSFFGFDPINKQYKALFMAYPSGPDDHRIMTLGTKEMRWRKIKCSLIHDGLSEGVCINGVLYYLGYAYEEMSEEKSTLVIVCFDVRSEKFKFIYLESFCELIKYKGKLGVIYRDNITDDTMELRLWVLDDVEKQEWSKYAYILRGENFFPKYVSVVGVISTGELIFSMDKYTSKKPFYVFYFNLERKTLQRVEIQGFGEFLDTSWPNYPWRVDIFADHVEDLNVNDPKLLKSSIYAPYVYTEESEEEDSEINDSYLCFSGKKKKKKADDEGKEEHEG